MGSGNVGATNVARAVGKWQGVLTLLADAVKGMLPAAIGSGAFWKEATAWIAGGDTTEQMLDNIEAAWKALPAG